MIGERLYHLVLELMKISAGKVTGMLLEMEKSAVIDLLHDKASLTEMVNEANQVLDEHDREQTD